MCPTCDNGLNISKTQPIFEDEHGKHRVCPDCGSSANIPDEPFKHADDTCMRDDLIMERSMNEHWSVANGGELGDFLSDGGASEFSNYLCGNCDLAFDTWHEALAHLKGAA